MCGAMMEMKERYIDVLFYDNFVEEMMDRLKRRFEYIFIDALLSKS